MEIENGFEDTGVEEVESPSTENEGTPDAPPAGEAPAEAPPPAYTPNFKYKVLKEEKEVPEWARPIVTNPEMEKTVREVFEKADGIEPVKAHRDQLLQENEGFKKEWVPFINEATEAINFAKKGDFDSFFEKVGITEKQVLEYALHRLNLREDPAKLSAYEETRKVQLRNAELEQQAQLYQNDYQNLAVQQREYELKNLMDRPEIRPIVEAFESRIAPGAFRKEVIRRAQAYGLQGQDVPAETVVQELVQLIGWQGQQSTPQPHHQSHPAETAARIIPPTLPNFQGKGTSPAKRVARSTDELRQMARTLKE